MWCFVFDGYCWDVGVVCCFVYVKLVCLVVFFFCVMVWFLDCCGCCEGCICGMVFGKGYVFERFGKCVVDGVEICMVFEYYGFL